MKEQYVAETKIKKYKEINGYRANAYCSYSFMKHLCFKFNISEYQMKKYIASGKVVIK